MAPASNVRRWSAQGRDVHHRIWCGPSACNERRHGRDPRSGFVYIAAADLIPDLQHERGIRALVTQTLLIAAGIAVTAV